LWDGIGYKLALPPPRHDRLADYRVLVLTRHPLCPTAASITAALEGLTDRLARAGCTIVRTSPKMPDLARTTRDYAELLAAIFSADLTPEERVRYEAEASALPPENLSLRAAELRGLTMSHPAWIGTSGIGNGLRARWQALFKEVDLVLCPPMPTAAFRQDHSPMTTRQLDVDGRKIRYLDQIAWCAIATLTGLPATVAPIGKTDGGLPVGVQIIGGYLEDRTTIGFAGLTEREFGGFSRPPDF
jgi:amidase